MKKLVILLFIINLYANDTKEILFLLENLKKIQYNYKPINALFNNVKKTKVVHISKSRDIKSKKTKFQYILEVVFNNKVKISGKWYKSGDTINNYKIVVVNNSVLLKNKNKIISLKFKPKVLK